MTFADAGLCGKLDALSSGRAKLQLVGRQLHLAQFLQRMGRGVASGDQCSGWRNIGNESDTAPHQPAMNESQSSHRGCFAIPMRSEDILASLVPPSPF